MPVTGPALISAMERTQAASPVLWWMGHCGFAIKYYDIVFYVDPYLPVASPVQPGELRNADLVLCTHSGPSHMDGATLREMLQASTRAKVVVPKSAATQAHELGIPYHRMTTTDSDLRVEYFKMGIYARVYAVPSAHPSLDWTPIGGYPYLGYLVRCGSTTIYHSGDSVPYEGLAERLRPYNVNVAMLAVGGPEKNNFTPEQAADLAAAVGAEWLIPMHYGPDSMDVAERFTNHMLFHRPEQRFKVFQPWESWAVPGELS